MGETTASAGAPAGARRVVGVNGGPRKKRNTARLLEKALEGAAGEGAEAELVHLYDLDYKGCVSCFSCKTVEGWNRGRCARRDGLSPLLESLEDAAAVIVGSPIYLHDVTGALRSMLERWMFINLAYDHDHPSVRAAGRMAGQAAGQAVGPAVGIIYAMNVPEEMLETFGYRAMFESHRQFLARLGGPAVEQLWCCDTLQFDDYGRYHAPMFDGAHKRRVREERFPLDLERARQMGARLAAAGLAAKSAPGPAQGPA
jgi:multimeric flavodoxin WrbA